VIRRRLWGPDAAESNFSANETIAACANHYGSIDPLRSEGQMVAQRRKAAGVTVDAKT